MALIDDEGRLFGVVNVIDAAVVLAVLTMVVASAGLVVSEQTDTDVPPQETSHAILTYTASSGSDLAWVERNDTVTLQGGTRATVTDTYRSYVTGQKLSVVVAISYQKPVTGSGVLGGRDSVRLTAGKTTTAASILAKDAGPNVPTTTVPVLLSANVSTPTASSIQRGDTIRIGDQRLAEVKSVTAVPTGSRKQKLRLGVALVARETDAGPVIGGRPLRIGKRVTLVTDRSDFNTTVLNVGTTDPPGERKSGTVTVEWESVRPSVADSIAVGMSDRGATITDIERSPATIVVTGAEGNVYAREHPINQDVTITLDATLTRSHGTLYLFDTAIREGKTIDLYFSNTHVRGMVTDVET